jgi:dihydroorotase
LPQVTIKAGEKADLTLFRPDQEWNFSKENILSKSSNSPFIGERLKGKVMGIIHNQQFRAVQHALVKN